MTDDRPIEPAKTTAPEETRTVTEPAAPQAELLSIDEFARVELKVAQVVAAERVEGADRLLRLQVDLGDEQRQLVAGIAVSYQPEELIGRRIIVVANLKPAKIRGVVSRGMLLAAVGEGGRPIVATFDEPVPPGTRVS